MLRGIAAGLTFLLLVCSGAAIGIFLVGPFFVGLATDLQGVSQEVVKENYLNK